MFKDNFHVQTNVSVIYQQPWSFGIRGIYLICNPFPKSQKITKFKNFLKICFTQELTSPPTTPARLRLVNSNKKCKCFSKSGFSL